MPDNIVTTELEDVRLDTQQGRQIPQPATTPVAGGAVAAMQAGATAAPPQEQGLSPETPLIQEAALPTAEIPEPMTYPELVLGGNPMYQLSPDLGAYTQQQLSFLAGQNRQSFIDRIEQVNPMSGVIFQNQPSLVPGGYDPRWLMQQDDSIIRNNQAFGRMQVPYRANLPTLSPSDDPRVPNSLNPVVPGAAPGSVVTGRRGGGDYDLPAPPNAWAGIGRQLTSFGRLLQSYAADTLTPDDGQWNWELDDIGSVVRNLTISPLVQSATGMRPADQSMPRTIQAAQDFVAEIAPAENPDANNRVSPWYFNPLRGYFGEMGRGLPGAAFWGLSLPGQVAMASIYSYTDLASYLGGQLPTWNNRDGSEFEIPFYRYQQALTGQDLGFTNFRDGSGNRYLATIPVGENVPAWQQWAWGAVGFIGDTIALGWVDDALYRGVRLTPTALEGMRRGMSPQQAIEAAQRLDNINGIRRAGGSVPDFTQRPGSGTPPSTPSPATGAPSPSTANVPPSTIPQIAGAAGASPTIPMGGIPTIQQILPSNQTVDDIVNFVSPIRRTNEQLAEIGQQWVTPNGVPLIPPGTRTLTNQERGMLENLFGDLFARYGHDPDTLGIDLPAQRVTTEFPGSRVAEPFDLERYSDAVQNIHRAINNASESTLDVEQVVDDVHTIVNMAPPPNRVVVETSHPSYVRAASDELVGDYLGALDETVDAGRATRALEESMDELHQSMHQHAEMLNTTYRSATRGHVMDEVANRAMYGDNWDDVNVRISPRNEFANPRPVEPQDDFTRGLRDNEWFHGSKNIFDPSQVHPDRGSSANEFGTGLYLTDNPELAETYAKMGRNPTQVIVGERRVTQTGNVYRIQAETTRTLNLNQKASDSVRRAFLKSAAEVFGRESEVYDAYAKSTRRRPISDYWLLMRDSYARANNDSAIAEIQYRQFSQNVAEHLRRRGWDSLAYESKTSGVGRTLVVLDQPERLPVTGLERIGDFGKGTNLEGHVARNQADRLLALEYARNPDTRRITEAWELQSRLQMENAVMQELVAAHNDATRRGSISAQRLAELDNQARIANRTRRTSLIESAIRRSGDEAETTAREYLNIKTDSPCL